MKPMKISKLLFSVLFLSFIFTSCSSKQEKMLSEIESLEQGDSTLSIEDVDKLMKAYGDFAMAYPEHERSEVFLYRALKHHYHIGELERSEKECIQYLGSFAEGKHTRQVQWVMGNIQRKHHQEPAAALRWYEKAGTEKANPTELQDLYATYELWQLKNSQKDSAAWYAYQAATGYANLEDAVKAIQLCDTVAGRYPGSALAPKALFLKAFTAENQLADVTTAKAAYEQLLQDYPEHELAKQAELILQENLLGMSADEMLDRILKKQNQ
jgi:outer membrane protein assembly factor BamD (BamD/ComL family)